MRKLRPLGKRIFELASKRAEDDSEELEQEQSELASEERALLEQLWGLRKQYKKALQRLKPSGELGDRRYELKNKYYEIVQADWEGASLEQLREYKMQLEALKRAFQPELWRDRRGWWFWEYYNKCQKAIEALDELIEVAKKANSLNESETKITRAVGNIEAKLDVLGMQLSCSELQQIANQLADLWGKASLSYEQSQVKEVSNDLQNYFDFNDCVGGLLLPFEQKESSA